jgi:hypothetical protein
MADKLWLRIYMAFGDGGIGETKILGQPFADVIVDAT